MQGWIKMHRKILENDLWHDVTAFRLFTLLLLKASHKDGVKTAGIEVNRGQYLRSYSKLAEDLEYLEGRSLKKVPKSTIERKVKKLVDAGIVSVRETVCGTLFTINKYESYQGNDEPLKPDGGTEPETLAGRMRDDDGTNAGQEQELKNLRIQELNLAADKHARGSSGPTDYQKRLLTRYVQLRGGFYHNAKDEIAASKLEKDRIPIETAIAAMERKFGEFEPKYRGDKINSLSYCSGAIYDAHHTPNVPKKSEQQKRDEEQQYDYGF